MKKIALIIAGGVGARTGQNIPKQFINVFDKPILIYTLEQFQKIKEITEIVVVCLDGWKEVLRSYAMQYGISKLTQIVDGGGSAQESIFCGLRSLKERMEEDDIVIIHDGIRPMVSSEVVISCIDTCIEKGNGITALPVYEQVFEANTESTSNKYIPREQLRILQTPQAYHFSEIFEVYDSAFKNGIGIKGSSYANTLMTDFGKVLYFALGSTKNIKITTADDIAIFKAMLSAEGENKKG